MTPKFDTSPSPLSGRGGEGDVTGRRQQKQTALEQIAARLERDAHLEAKDEAACYAERIDRLGRVMFGDLWDADESEATSHVEEHL